MTSLPRALRFSRCSLLIVVLLFTACSTSVKTRILTFKEQGLSLGSGTVHIEALEPELAGTQQFRYYARGLSEKLAGLGLTVVDSDKTDYVAKLGFQVNRREAEDRNGGSVVVSTGFGFYRGGHGAGLLFSGDRDTEFEFERVVNVGISRQAGESLLEVSAISVGRCDSLPSVYPQMLDAIFQNLFRADGSTVTVSVPAQRGPCSTSSD